LEYPTYLVGVVGTEKIEDKGKREPEGLVLIVETLCVKLGVEHATPRTGNG